MHTSLPKKRMPLIVRVLYGGVLALLSTLGTLVLLVVLWMRSMHHPWFRERWVRWNKRRLNPTTLKIAGRHASVYAALTHVGRHSGRVYTTPVVAKPLGDGFVIPLPYGAGVDWCRNVLAAGTCTLTCNEQDYRMERPEVLQPSDALVAFRPVTQWLYIAGGITQYLWVHQHQELLEKMPGHATPQEKDSVVTS